MQCRPYITFLQLLVCSLTLSCVDSTKVGLSNVRAHELRPARTDKGTDVISNGDDSCEKPGSARPDPAPLRLNPCPNVEKKSDRVAATK